MKMNHRPVAMMSRYDDCHPVKKMIRFINDDNLDNKYLHYRDDEVASIADEGRWQEVKSIKSFSL